MDEREDQRVHDALKFIGLRATVTAVGLLRLAAELVKAGVLDEAALERIKDAMVKELSLNRPPNTEKDEYERSMRERLTRLLSGEESIGPVTPQAANTR
jgi:hypothetical protein